MIDPDLAQFRQTRSPDAFRALVERHIHLVHAYALRQLHDHHLAEETTQAVFIVLSRKAPSLPPDTILPAWLFKTTRYACANARRSESRRRRHEHEAAMQRTELPESDPNVVSDLAPLLDTAMARLGTLDRNVLLLRYYAGLTAAQVAQQLGLSAEATRRRISRAIIKLREKFPGAPENITPLLLITCLDTLSTHATSQSLVQTVVAQSLDPALVSPSCTALSNGVIHMVRCASLKPSMAVLTAFLALAIGGAALTSAIESPATPPQPSQTAALDPSTGAPASDVQSIQSTLTLLAQTIRANDSKGLEQCLAFSKDDDGALLKALMLDNMAVRHLQTAWTAKFAQPMSFTNVGFVWFPLLDGGMEVLFEKTAANLEPSDIQITGAGARLPLRFAPRNINPDPTGGWAGAWLQFTKDGPLWKLDLNKTMRIGLYLVFKANKHPQTSQKEIQIAAAFKTDLAKLLNDNAALIESGKLATAALASRKVERETIQLFGRHGLAGVRFSTQPVSPISAD